MKTIEEAAKEHIKEYSFFTAPTINQKRLSFIEGANWQKEQLLNELIEAFKVEGIHYTKEFLLKLLEQNTK